MLLLASTQTHKYTENAPGLEKAQLHPYLELARLDRPVGTLLLLWPTLAALCMAAQGIPPLHLVIIFTLGTFLMRSAGCVINDYADRHVDGSVERTRNRPIPRGAVTETEALLLFAGLAAGAGILLLFLNTPTKLLALAGLAIAGIYPFMKRWTHLPQVILGAAFSWGLLMAWTSIHGELSRAAGILFLASLLWIVAYDTMYAMVDREDDLKIGVKSTAILFGNLDLLIIAILQATTLLSLALAGGLLQYSHGYYIGLTAIAGLFFYQQRLLRKRERAGCFAAFKNNTWVGFALLAGTLLEFAINRVAA